jgi:hypothetical protein
MKLVAPAPRIGINFNLSTRNLILALMCAVFGWLFIRDGFFVYPANNDRIVRDLANARDVSEETRERAAQWKGWNNETVENREAMSECIKKEKNAEAGRIAQGWKQPFDVTLQRLLAVVLVGVNVWSLTRLVRYLRKRVECDDAGISPARGLVIPWEKITQVDNADWRSADIVMITYTDAAGAQRKAALDGFEVDRAKLVPILEQLSEKAVDAEFVPKEEEARETPAQDGPGNGSTTTAEGGGATFDAPGGDSGKDEAGK